MLGNVFHQPKSVWNHSKIKRLSQYFL